MANTKFLRGKVLRLTKLDRCGVRVLGPESVITSEGSFISLGLTMNIFEKSPIQQENANGDRCINDKPRPKLEDITVNGVFCGMDPNVINFLTGNPLVYNDATTPEAYGIDITDDVDVEAVGVAIEVWSDTPSDACEDGFELFGYGILPRVGGGVIGDQSWENGAINFTINNMLTKRGNAWGVGPYDVELDADGLESPLLQPLPVNGHQRIIPTKVPPPVGTLGPTALGVEATGANSSTTPATLSPANSYAPLDLADAIAGPFTATPTSAWTVGKYVLTRSGQRIHWSGTAWVNGVA